VNARWRGCFGIAALLLAIGCDKSGSSRKSESPTQYARRLAGLPKRGGLQFAGDPTTPPPVAELLTRAQLIPVVDGVRSSWDDPLAGHDTWWIGPVIDRLDDGDSGRRVLAVRRAAFGQHVPAAGERGEVDDETLLDTGYADERNQVILIGPARQCIAGRGPAQVIAAVVGGHVLDLRWPLLGCDGEPWAPVGLIVDRQPSLLRWLPSACPDPQAITEAWSVAAPDPRPEAWTELGALVIAEVPYALLAHDGARGVMLIAPQNEGGAWTTRGFEAAELTPKRNGCAPPLLDPMHQFVDERGEEEQHDGSAAQQIEAE
jgi:hypothetical protein